MLPTCQKEGVQGHFFNNTIVSNTNTTSSLNDQTLTELNSEQIQSLSKIFNFYVKPSLRQSLITPRRKLAIISGAGIAGLAASIVLRNRGFNVVVVEKRDCFSRKNIINLNIEVEVFLKSYALLEKFKTVAAKIKQHQIIAFDHNNAAHPLSSSDVSQLQLQQPVSFNPKDAKRLFKKNGVYSISIGALQTCLAEHALELGVNLFGNATIEVLSHSENGVSEVRLPDGAKQQPDLFFIAEGKHSSTARQLGIKRRNLKTACTGEIWSFGNMPYFGKETFVVSAIDSSRQKSSPDIANVIFNAKEHAINIAVTLEKNMSDDDIQKKLLMVANKVFHYISLPPDVRNDNQLIIGSSPVHIDNYDIDPFSMGNVACIGDTAGADSPLAGNGGTKAMTFVPASVEQLIEDDAKHPEMMHTRFHQYSKVSIKKWSEKSASVKKLCLKTAAKFG